MSVDLGAGGSPDFSPSPTIGANPFQPKRAATARQVDRDDAAAQAHLDADEETAAAEPGKLAALVGSIRSALVGLLHRRRQAEESASDLGPATDEPAGPTPDPASPGAGPEVEPRRAPRWSPAAWSWETRVGVAAVLSFVILVGVLVGKRWGTGGTKPVETPGAAGDRRATPILAAGTTGKNSGQPEPPAHPQDPGPTSPPIPNVATRSGILTQTPAAGPTAAAGGTSSARILPPNDQNSPVTGPLAGLSTGSLLPPSAADGNLASASPDGVPPMPKLPAAPSDAPPLPGTTTAEAKEGAESKPPEPEIKTAGGSPPETKAVEPPTADPVVPSTTAAATDPVALPNPTPQPADPPAAEPPPTLPPADLPTAAAPTPMETAPIRPVDVPNLQAVPPSSASAPATKGPDWVAIPSAGKRPGAPLTTGGDPETSGAGAALTTTPAPRTRAVESPPTPDEPGSGAGEVLHTVQANENFWTISKKYYQSSRYYKALHKVNAAQVPDIAKLYVGTVIRIPPPEALDRALVERTLVEPPAAPIDGLAVSRTSSATRVTDGGADAMPPPRSTRPGLRRARNEPVEAPRRPTYRVKANDTLRSIARDTLEDSRRSSEIYNLNRDLLDDPKSPLAPGTILTLPDDAVIGRRMR